MELIYHEVVLQSASPYLSAPTSPKTPNRGMQFYTAPSSPAEEALGDDLFFDDFEFSTSQKFDDFIDLEISQNSEHIPVNDQPQQQQGKPRRERGGSLPTMAFADELFYNGLVMPLKPPPRLQTSQENGNCFRQGSVPSSPKSPQSSSFIKVPFVHKAVWNDDFDPFKVALQKVSEESRGRASNARGNHRRTRSHSPFRTNNSWRWNDQHDEAKEDKILNDQEVFGQKFGLPKEPKGSPYARFVINQNKQVEEIEKGRKKPQKLQSGRRIRPVKMDHVENGVAEWKNNVTVERGIKRIRSIFLKYALFGRENSEEKASNNQSSTLWKSNYFKKLSFKVKGNNNPNGNVKKRGIEEEDPKMQVIESKRNKPSLALCLGYGFEHHKNMDYSL
ncbi:uncharacterized protein [Coffea arabica]|uniref:Uncharacterized protein n=1 Tax=Coffea arabica TaxID=13443 RepID=A0ABM4UVQ6_COFAR